MLNNWICWIQKTLQVVLQCFFLIYTHTEFIVWYIQNNNNKNLGQTVWAETYRNQIVFIPFPRYLASKSRENCGQLPVLRYDSQIFQNGTAWYGFPGRCPANEPETGKLSLTLTSSSYFLSVRGTWINEALFNQTYAGSPRFL